MSVLSMVLRSRGRNNSLHDIMRAADELEALEVALDLALEILVRNEPGDSRAVSDEFVAMAAIRAGDRSPEMVAFALKAKERIAALPPLPPPEITVTYGDEVEPCDCCAGIRQAERDLANIIAEHDAAVDENGCHTLSNGDCVSPGPCIHSPEAAS